MSSTEESDYGSEAASSLSLALLREGILVSKAETHFFVPFSGDEHTYNVTRAQAKHFKKAPVCRIDVPALIGFLKFQVGYLIVVSQAEKAVELSNLQVFEISQTVLIPLEYDAALPVFEKWASGDRAASRSSQEEPSAVEPPAKLQDDDKEPEDGDEDGDDINIDAVTPVSSVPQAKDQNVLFTKIGILTQSIKESPLLGLNNYQMINDHISQQSTKENNELFDLRAEDDKFVKEQPVNRPHASYTFNSEMVDMAAHAKMKDDKDSLKHHQFHYITPSFIKKFLNNVTKYFDKGGFYFSHSVNIVEDLQYSNGKFSTTYRSLADLKSDFFWNQDIIADFVNLSQEADKLVVTPIIQGFIDTMELNGILTQEEKERQLPEDQPEMPSKEMETGEDTKPDVRFTKAQFAQDFNKFTANFKRSFNLNKETSDGILETSVSRAADCRTGQLLLISRRSNKRCGVRYLRRGIDDDSNVANFVKTSQILIVQDLGIFAKYDITRGSIPLFFEQDPSKLQPTPKLTRSEKQSEAVLTKHFERLMKSYHDVTTVSLVEKKRREQVLGQTFEHLMAENLLKFVWFDFHDVCKNMKFSNVRLLLDQEVSNDAVTIADQIRNYGWSDHTGSVQSGIFRINCVDCLDRTNIVSKFLSEEVLRNQMEKFQLVNDDGGFNSKFSNLWANNGDRISQQYCSTNAMKGDFTRTNKRNYKGLLNDAVLSLTRYYYNAVSDFYNQFVIDYLLYHNENDLDFVENFESLLENFDPNLNSASSLQKALVMENVVKLFHQDEVLGNWWVKSCFQLNRLKRDDNILKEQPLPDCILILTRENIFLIDPQLDTNKLVYYKVSINTVTLLTYGHYYTSTFTSNDKNPKKNIGLKFEFSGFQKLEDQIKSTMEDGAVQIELVEGAESVQCETAESQQLPTEQQFLAIKFDPTQLSYHECKIAIRLISSVCYHSELLKKDIINFEDAKRSSSLVKNIDYRVKKFIWG